MKNILLFFSALICWALLQGCKGEEQVDFSETYFYKGSKPFDTDIAFRLFNNSFENRRADIVTKQFSENRIWDYDTSAVYFNVSNNFLLDSTDAEYVLDFAYRGNTAFISANYIDTVLLNKLFCPQSRGSSAGGGWRNTALFFAESINLYKDSFSYRFLPFGNAFEHINGDYARIAGRNEAGQINFFVFFWGKGRIYLHCEPRAFGNYFLLTRNNNRYLEQIMRMLPAAPQNIYWDNFHNRLNYSPPKNTKDFSTLSAILASPPLAKAFFIGLALLILYVLFNGKRRQRMMPIIKPPQNTSVAFAEAIAGLYLSQKDNRLIAEKMINYFNDHVRTKYFFTLQPGDAGYEEMLTRKSGADPELTVRLVALMKELAVAATVSDRELLLLNDLLEKFFKTKI